MSGSTRKTKTGHYLIGALVEITRHKNVSAVTVKELCKKAQVNRTTFYKHYHDFPDFLKWITENFIDEMTRYVDKENPYSQLLFGDDPLFYFTRCVEFMNAHADFMRMMVGKNGSLEFQEQVKGVWVAQIYEALLAEQSKLEGLDIDIQAHFIASGMWGCFCST
jgi:AcrR family transcriptional regulator